MNAPTHINAGVTERAAARRAARWAVSLEAKVLRALAAAGEDGLTAEEARDELGIGIERHYSVAPRLSVLKHKGWVEGTDTVRGRFQVYRATPAGITQAQAVDAG